MSHPELLGPPPKPGRYVKVSIFLKKRPDISDDYFNAYWYHNHTAKFLHVKAFKTLVRKYNQSHYLKDEIAVNSEILPYPKPEFDGVAEFWVDNMDDWRKLWSDPEFKASLKGDNAHFVSQPLYTAAGYDYPFHDDTANGTDKTA